MECGANANNALDAGAQENNPAGVSSRFYRGVDPAPSSSRVAQFRGEKSRSPLPLAEKRLLVVLGVHLCFLPWALGTVHPWSQLVSLGLAVIGFWIALTPREHEAEAGWSASPFRTAMAPRLWRFPIFWIGLALLVYVAVQGFNPWFRYVEHDGLWGLARLPDVAWLPTSVAAPFEKANAWRQLIIYGSAWLVACSAWVGLTRRRSSRILLMVLAANALVLGILLIYQRATGEGRLPWPLIPRSTTALPVASFVYPNHAGSYFVLMVFVAITLATWGYDHGARTLKKSTPTAALLLLTLFLVGAVLFTLSRGASLTLAGMLVAFVGWFWLRQRLRPIERGTDSRVTITLAVIFGLFALYVGRSIDFSSVYNRFGSMMEKRAAEESVSSRIQAHAAARQMLENHWVRGVGAGGFRYLFVLYVRQYPEIYQDGNLFWEHAHCDWLEIPIELGAAGVAILLVGAGCVIGALVRRRHQWSGAMIPLLFGCLATLLHATIDFPFACPAILVTWCVMLTMTVRSLDLQR